MQSTNTSNRSASNNFSKMQLRLNRLVIDFQWDAMQNVFLSDLEKHLISGYPHDLGKDRIKQDFYATFKAISTDYD